MATIYREFSIGADPDAAWTALRDVGKVNRLITFLGTVTVEGDHRVCELGDQGKLNELIVSIDDERRRLVYAIQESPFNFEFHGASMQILPNGDSGSRFVWTSDVKPDAVVPDFSKAIDGAVESLRQTLQ